MYHFDLRLGMKKRSSNLYLVLGCARTDKELISSIQNIRHGRKIEKLPEDHSGSFILWVMRS
jgi:hypothetical protein